MSLASSNIWSLETGRKSTLQRFNQIINGSAIWFARLGGMMIALIGVLITIDVISRNLFGRMVVNSLEFSSYLFAGAMAFGMAYAATSGAHIRIDAVSAKMPPKIRRALDLLALVALASLALFLFYFSIGITVDSYERGIRSNSAIAFPLFYPQLLWLIGLGCFAMTTVMMAVRMVVLLATGRAAEADRLSYLGNPEQEVDEALNEVRGQAS
jgi:TRAP-type C4-dicarboxylate transport system permease small subunit